MNSTPGNSEGQGSLACCCPWDRKESDNLATEQQQLIYEIVFFKIEKLTLSHAFSLINSITFLRETLDKLCVK